MHGPAPRMRRAARSRAMRSASRSPGQRPDSTSSARSATAGRARPGTRLGGDRQAAAGRLGEQRRRPARRAPPRSTAARVRSVASVARSAATGSSISVVSDRGDGRPPPRRGHVQVPQLQVAAQPDRREQRGQVRRRDRPRSGSRPPSADRAAGPLLERDRRAHGRGVVAAGPDEDHRGAQGVARPGRRRVEAASPVPGSAATQPGTGPQARASRPAPGPLPGRLPARVAPVQPGRARRDRHQRRPEPVRARDPLRPSAFAARPAG